MKKRKCRFFCIAAAMATLLTACRLPVPPASETTAPESVAPEQTAPTPSATAAAYTPEWLWEPYLEAARIVGLPENGRELNQQEIFSHLAIQVEEGGGWQFLNAETGRIFPDTPAEPHFFATIGGELPLFPWVPDPEAEGLEEELAQLSQQEGIGIAYEGAGAYHFYPPVWIDGEWLSMGYLMDGLTSFDPQWNPLEFPDPVSVALYIAPDNPDWQRGDPIANPEIRWQYVGDNTNKPYDAAILVDSGGRQINDQFYEDGRPYREGVAALEQNGKWGYLDTNGQPISDFCYEPMLPGDCFSMEATVPYSANEGMIPVKKDGLCGLIDTQGREVIPLQFEDITSVYHGTVWAKQNGKWGVLKVPAV